MTQKTPTPAERIAAARQDLLAVRADLEKRLKTDKTRARGGVVRMLHEVQGMLTPAFPYASQSGQDRIVERILKGKTDGVFVDVGAYDGVTGSNTLYLERHMGWTGVLVEPVQQFRTIAEKWRSSPCLPYAVADQTGEADFIAVTKGFTQMSGLEAQYDVAMLTRVRADPRHAEDKITVPTRSLNEIFAETGLSDVDFVSLDIEGGELAALKAFEFDVYPVKVWAIENNTGSAEIATLMRSHGYQLAEFCGVDEIYMRSDL